MWACVSGCLVPFGLKDSYAPELPFPEPPWCWSRLSRLQYGRILGRHVMFVLRWSSHTRLDHFSFHRRFPALEVDLRCVWINPCHTTSLLIKKGSISQTSRLHHTMVMATVMTPTFQSRVDLLWPAGPIHIRDGPHYLMGTVMGNGGNGLCPAVGAFSGWNFRRQERRRCDFSRGSL